MPNKHYFMSSVLLPEGWASGVRLSVASDGLISEVVHGVDLDPNTDTRISGAVIAGVANCHSHAHQRAMSGLGEKASIDLETKNKASDSFWTWRSVMYHYLGRIQPHHLHAIASQLYLEMLKSGYTNIAEFQYLHHDLKGDAYENPAEMTLQCMQAARSVGIGFTALPVLYRYGGFGGQSPLEGQKRFLNDADQFCEIVNRLFQAASEGGAQTTAVGIAPHSLRAVTDGLLNEVLNSLSDRNLAAVHVHVAEQTKEVDDCLAWSSQRPVEWMMDKFDVDENWCAIHATHMTKKETIGLAKSGAVAGLCPSTEGNLGDGFFDINTYSQNNGSWAIGSDSHISISPVEELRWLEYGRRLVDRKRNILATEKQLHTGMELLTQALRGGKQSSGLDISELKPGCRADFVVLDDTHPRLYGRAQSDIIDSWIFSGNENLIKDVYVSGEAVILDRHHPLEQEVARNYRRAIDALAAS